MGIDTPGRRGNHSGGCARHADFRRDLGVCLLLALSTLAVYAPVRGFDFVNYDDPEYVTGNPHVRNGLTVDGIVWAFTHSHSANWHPLTWISHMLDCQLFGLNPAAHHLTNVLLHIANTVLLFWVLNAMTGRRWRSGFVAALFALHPLHVESVAWVSERKDVLGAFFWMLTLAAYVRYVRRPTWWRYAAVALVFALGLMAKQMVVTLPVVLLLLDLWPLGRLEVPPFGKGGQGGIPPNVRPNPPQSPFFKGGRGTVVGLVIEKLPLIGLAVAASAITFVAQRHGGAVVSAADRTLTFRAANALIAYVTYLVKMVWPSGLAVFYPTPAVLLAWWVAGAALVLSALSVLAFRAARQRPYLLVGWLWYLGTLVPVIGIVQVGDQAMADRYTYLPLVGIFIIVTWGACDLAARWPSRRIGLGLVGTAALAACCTLTWRQLHYWRNGSALFQRALAVTADNHVAHLNFGQILFDQGDLRGALGHFTEVVRIRPGFAKARVNLAAALAATGETDAAMAQYAEALRLDPNESMAHLNLGLLLAARGDLDAALAHCAEALRLDPMYAKAHTAMGLALAAREKWPEAIAHYREAIRLDPESAAVHNSLAIAFEHSGRAEEAIQQYAEVVRIVPDDPRGHYNLASALADQGRLDEAIHHYRETLRRKADFPEAHYALGIALARKGDFPAAATEFRAALAARPDWPAAQAALESVLASGAVP